MNAAPTPPLISCTLEPFWILKASPTKSWYTAAIIKKIVYSRGPKATLNHKLVSERGTPSLGDKCVKWKYRQGLQWISIYLRCDPALQGSAQGTLHGCTPEAATGSSVHCPQPALQAPAPRGAVPRVLGTQGSSGTTAECSTSTTCALLGTEDTQWIVSGWKRTLSCFDRLLLQQGIALPGGRNGPKMNSSLLIPVSLISLTITLLQEEQLWTKCATSPFCSPHPTSPELLSSLDSVLADLIPFSNDSPS